MKAFYLFLPVLLLLAGCNSVLSDKAPKTFSTASNNGLVIGTLTFNEDVPKNDIYRFFYNAQSESKSFRRKNAGKIMIKARENNTRGFSGDFNNSKTYLFVIERQPGPYAFTEYNMLNHIGATGQVSFSKKFAIPFEVQSGKIAYMGEMEFFGKAEPTSARIVVSDQYSRDLPEFKKKFPQINWDDAANKTVKSGDTGEGMVEFK